MSSTALQHRLNRLRQRIIALGVSAGAGWGAVLAAVVVLVALWLDLVLELSPAMRLGGEALALLGGLVLFVGVMATAWRDARPTSMARQLDRAGQTGGQILSGVELLRANDSDTPDSLTAGLAQMAVQQAGRLSQSISGAAAAPARTVLWPCIAIAIIAVAVGIVAALSPRLASTQWARFADPFGDHPPYSRLTFTVEPGDTKVIYGSALDIRAAVEGGVAEDIQVVLQMAGSRETEAVPMFPDPGGKWRATLGSVTSAGTYCLQARGARSHRYAIDLVTVPRIAGVRFRITPPAYANRPAYEGPLPQGGISGLAGTRVQLWITSNRPLASGSLQLAAIHDGPATMPATVPASAPTTSPSQLALTPTGAASSEVTGAFTIDRNTKLTASVMDLAGQPSTDSFSAPVVLVPDGRPFVRVMEPPSLSLATPDAIVPVNLMAEDDCGISRLQLYRSLNDSRVWPMEVPLTQRAQARVSQVVPLKLADYALSPGDVVKVFARAQDNDPAGAKGAETSITVIRIVSQEEMQSLAAAQEGLESLLAKYDQASRRLEAVLQRLAKIEDDLAKLDPKADVPDELRQALEQLSGQMAKDAVEIAKAAQHKLPFDIDKALTGELDKAAQAMDESAKTAEGLARALALSAGQIKAGVAELRKKLDGARQGYEKEAAQPLEHLAKVYPLIEDEAAFVAIYERQRDLADRMASLRGTKGEDDPSAKSRMRDLEEEQRRIRQDLDELLGSIERHAAELPEDARLIELRDSAKRFAAAVKESNAGKQMAAAENALTDFDGSPAHAAAKDAADILQRFLEQAGKVGNQAAECLKFQPRLAGALGRTVEQLLGGEAGRGEGSRGGGYSMRQHTLRNVGLYGRQASPMASAKSGSGTARRGAAGNAGAEQPIPSGSDVSPGPGGRAVGESAAAVPPQYRRRVSDYFQRVADELEEK